MPTFFFADFQCFEGTSPSPKCLCCGEICLCPAKIAEAHATLIAFPASSPMSAFPAQCASLDFRRGKNDLPMPSASLAIA
jgi:hypothetical protein